MVIPTTSPAKALLAANFRFLRHQTAMAQSAVARASGVSQKTISNLENPDSDSTPLVTNVEKLCRYYGVSPSSLLALNFSKYGVEPQHFSDMITQFSAFNPERRALVLSLARQLAIAETSLQARLSVK